jgi:hypothetical protein
LSSIQCAVMPRNDIAFGDVQVSSVKEIRPGAFYLKVLVLFKYIK